MKKIKRLKRLYNQLKDNLPIVLSIFSLSLSIIAFISAQYALRVTESWRDALSRSLEISSEGGKAYPSKIGDKWGVSFQPEPSVKVNVQISSHVVFKKEMQL